MKKIYYMFFAGTVSFACQKSAVDKKEEGIIRYKETITINDVPRSTLTFFDVSDSRCPEGVQCIVAGNATVDLLLEGVSTEGRISKKVKMCLGDCSAFLADTVIEKFAGNEYQFILKSVTPVPKKDVGQVKADYAVVLEIKNN